MTHLSMEGMMQVAVDAVVFTVAEGMLKILLIQRKNEPFSGKYALPGGFVEENEELEDAVGRELQEETGVKDIFLKQLGAYGKADRDPRGRVLSIAFLALISPDQELRAESDASDAKWFSIDNLPELAFDHEKIIEDALQHLKYEIQTTNIACQILPSEFTLSQLQRLYENVLGHELDKRNFRKRINELDILADTGRTMMEGAHRPARLFKFRNSIYSSIKDKVHVFL